MAPPRTLLHADMAVAATHHPELIEAYLARHRADAVDDSATSLLDSLAEDGDFLYVPAGHVESAPLAIGPRPGDPPCVLRNSLVVVGVGARIELVWGCTSPSFTLDPRRVDLLDVVLDDGASCTLAHVTHWSSATAVREARQVTLGRGAALSWCDVDLGPAPLARNFTVRLRGPGASFTHRGLAVAGAGRRLSWAMDVVAEAPGTRADLLWRGLGWGGGTWEAGIDLSAKAAAAGPRARCDLRSLRLDGSAKPRLTCSGAPAVRGAAVDQAVLATELDPDAVFYARSRGLARADAVGLIAEGFARPALEGLPPDFAADIGHILPLAIAGSLG